MVKTYDVAVIGHLCLDIIPIFKAGDLPISRLFVPGKLVDIGSAVMSTGGAASNTGLALHRLGFDVRIVAKVGNDSFGRIVMDILRDAGGKLASDMIVQTVMPHPTPSSSTLRTSTASSCIHPAPTTLSVKRTFPTTPFPKRA